MSGIRARLPLYVGGFMGPFGTIVIIPMFPELREEFGASSATVSLAYSLYLIPFAVLLLVSGTLGERWGRRRTVRGTYLLYGVTSVLAALAPVRIRKRARAFSSTMSPTRRYAHRQSYPHSSEHEGSCQ